MKAHGFVNLRGTGTASTNEDSVWPSFTDVMMVIVMVFLMALVVILIRNVDLTDQLDKTERRVELDSAQKTALEMNIAGLGDEVVGLRLQLGQVTRRAELAQLATADRDQQIGRLVQGVASLEQARDRLVRDNETLVGREGALQAELLSLEQTQQALLALRGELEAEVTRLDKEKAGVEKEGRALSKTLTTVTRERDVLLEDKAQLVKKQSALRIEKESMAARLAEQGTLLASRQKQLVTLSGAHQVLGEEQAAATEALRSRTSERDILSLEKARLLEEGTTNALRLEVLAEEKRELEAEVTRLDKEKAGVEKEGRALSKTLTTVTRERDVLLEDKAQLVKKQSALRIEKESMAAQLTETRQQQEGGAADIVRLRRQVVELDEKEQALAGERKVAQNVIERLEKTRTRMLQQAATLRAENAQLASDYLAAQRIQREMRKDIVGYSKKLDVAEGVQRTSVDALAARKARYAKEITALQVEQRALVDELKGQYSALQVKYDRLVRPARTFLGKHVVRIGYWKEGGIFRYSLREPGDLQARNINEQQLHRSLTALKSVYGKRLYTKILFPREAALSQKDAWRFTHQILRQYDYYAQ
ncbi:MAG: hypothetical protein OSA08_03495 [Arenicellales bacterium]|nr:hypothetical protein [Arenicellales bacterium]